MHLDINDIPNGFEIIRRKTKGRWNAQNKKKRERKLKYLKKKPCFLILSFTYVLKISNGSILLHVHYILLMSTATIYTNWLPRTSIYCFDSRHPFYLPKVSLSVPLIIFLLLLLLFLFFFLQPFQIGSSV